LYEQAYTLHLIDDTENEELDFVNAFTSPTPETLVNKIRFSKNNYIVAYFLESSLVIFKFGIISGKYILNVGLIHSPPFSN
jgi:hypothetical protein